TFSNGAKDVIIQKVNVSLLEDKRMPKSKAELSWKDFRGTPDTTSPYAAMIYTGIRMTYLPAKNRSKDFVEITLTPFVNRNRSWFKDSLATQELLDHERGHMNITKQMTRELAEKIGSRVFREENLKQEVDSLHKLYLSLLWERQIQYDKETNHGLEAEMQVAWLEKLESAISVP
ncbi:MAG: DUF922 domain-containing protein, partial [Sphingobacteriales bacterium]